MSLHLRATSETQDFLDEAKLRLMKPTAFLVNTSRGSVVDEEALALALREGWIAGAGLDVMKTEPPPPDHPLLALENVVLSGHSGGSTLDAVESWQAEWRAAFDAYLSGCWPPSVVNPGVTPKVPLSHPRRAAPRESASSSQDVTLSGSAGESASRGQTSEASALPQSPESGRD